MSSQTLGQCRQLRESSQAAIINKIDQLKLVPDTEDPRIDARMVGVFTPSSELTACGLLAVEKDTPIEVKSYIPRITASQ